MTRAIWAHLGYIRTMKTTYFLGVKAHKAAPTKKHVPAIWECMLGTVYACNPQGETRYFDYEHEAARAFAGVDQEGADIRLARAKRRMTGIRPGQLVLWIRRPVQSTCA
ncbi:hypothetical protein EBU60_02905 [bacterium]|nr:hypothetical protein [bacterium]